MSSPSQESDRILAGARQSLDHQRAGGRRVGSIGRQSAALKRQHLLRKLGRMGMAVLAVWFAAIVAGLVIDGIGWTGIILTIIASFVAFGVFARYPKMKVPSLGDLNKGDVKALVGRTELWLEAQRPALPAPAVQLVDTIGLQLDALGKQLQEIDQTHPAAVQVRKLVGEHLPGVVQDYRKIPANLRQEDRAGSSPDKQLAESLGLISGEIDSVTRQLASGAIDDLAIKTRYLDYKYGSGVEGEDTPALPRP
ncbi:hypothetical protein [Novosphingobium aquae]|uniref:5-bromo-4-chloroindolyl phosphate hydrolysis protein n=1 Tax=Novosphingobium aquae TaxID=3133435 RepID=A0ABU8SCI8_9SPHN